MGRLLFSSPTTCRETTAPRCRAPTCPRWAYRLARARQQPGHWVHRVALGNSPMVESSRITRAGLAVERHLSRWSPRRLT
jgi:hypothetical protein